MMSRREVGSSVCDMAAQALEFIGHGWLFETYWRISYSYHRLQGQLLLR